GGLREYQGQLSFAPQLPDRITRLSFTVQWRGLRLEVDIEPARATYGLRDKTDSTLAFRHNGEEVTVTAGKPVTAPFSKRPPLLPRPPQPPGREPLHQGES
ncbi:MAG: glycosyl hydrolase family 65 protein, partial [Propionibacteriaceae bacterium]